MVINRTVLWLGIAVVIVAAIGGGVLWTRERPQRVVSDAVTSVAAAPAQRFTAVVDLANSPATRAALGEQATVTINLDGVYRHRQDRPDFQSEVVLVIDSESVSLQLTGEVRFVDDKAYLLITKAPPVFPALAKVKGQWLELPRGGDTASPSTPVAAASFSRITSQGMEERNGVRVRKYEAVATQAAVVQFMNTIAHILGTNLTEQQLNELKQGTAAVEEVPVTLWITPISHKLRALQATLAVPGGNTVKLTLDLAEPTGTVAIEAPTETTTFQEALSDS
jgi:hypothetical protein